MWANKAYDYVVKNCDLDKVLDIGSGESTHKEGFKKKGATVITIDINADYQPDFVGDFVTTDVGKNYSLVWASHVLEHQPNVFSFLKKCFDILATEGWFAVTVPPLKHEIVGGHFTLWNSGLLLYNMIVAGFDCKHAIVQQYGYNISAIVQKKPYISPKLLFDSPDIETLAPYFPLPVSEGFDGQIENINWS